MGIFGNSYIPEVTPGTTKLTTAVLLNHGDDTGNGFSDITKGQGTTDDKDLEQITLWVSDRAKNLNNHRLQLKVPKYLKAWANQKKATLNISPNTSDLDYN